MAIRLQRSRDSASDLLKSIKQGYTTPPAVTYSADKVAARTWRMFELDAEDHWEETYRRHMKNKHRGLFSVSHQPYKVLGDKVQDVHEILLQNFKRGLPDKFLQDEAKRVRYNANLIVLGHSEKDQHAPVSKELAIQSKENDMCEYRMRHQQACTTGMKDIRDHLRETERRMVAVRAGKSYTSHVDECQFVKDEEAQVEQSRIEDKQGMELHNLSSHMINTGGNLATSDKDDGSWERKFTIAYENQTLVVKPKKTSKKFPAGSVIKMRKRLASQQERLETIYMLLCCMYNLHGRTLRKKTPLSVEALKTLKKNPFIYEEKDGLLTMKRHSTGQSSTLTLSSRAEMSTSNRNSTIDTPSVMRRMSMGRSSHDQNIRFGMRRKTLNRSGVIVKNSPSNAKDSAGPPPLPQVETWEDLLAIGKNRTPNRAAKRLPPWLPAANPIVEKVKTEVIKDEDVKHEEFHPDDSVWRTKLHLLELKESVQKETQNLLAKCDRERMVKFKYKLGAFSDLRPLWEEHCQNLALISREASRDPDAAVEEVVEWFCKLQAECEAAGCSEDQDICNCLSRLERFTLDDMTLFCHMKEKLCLIVMSMPVFEVCTANMQSAIKFVLQHILQLSEGLLEQWLHLRQLYLVPT